MTAFITALKNKQLVKFGDADTHSGVIVQFLLIDIPLALLYKNNVRSALRDIYSSAPLVCY